jgi:NAD(P)-dependent dehydrogenase (short-subunit alcohol dehydrogenase family)
MGISMFDLTDKVAIITGSGRGIGKAIALGFAEAGAHVVVDDRTASDVEATVSEIRAMGRRSLPVLADVRVGSQVEGMVQKVVAEFGRIDILVNNAGSGFAQTPVLEMSEEAWDDDVLLNLKTVFLCSKAVGKVMVKQRKGSIININSGSSVHPGPGVAAYRAAKAGVGIFTRTLSSELGPYNIRVNEIMLGIHETSHTTRWLSTLPQLQQQSLLRGIALGRFGQPQDVVGAAIYLTSDASAYVSGATILVNGGFYG